MQRSMQQDDLATSTGKTKGARHDRQGQAIDYYDKVVAPFVQHLADQGQIPAALQCLTARCTCGSNRTGNHRDQELNETVAKLRKG